jgi:CHAT domain-containing protein
VASLYPRRKTLIADAATKARFLEQLPRVDVLHFAGHAVVNPESPDLSRLMLAGPARADNALFAHEIARLPLTGVQVAVLAACETAIGRTYRSEGSVSWGSAFLAAGVPGVVATLWKIDDRPSRALFRSLHEALRRGATLSQAVRTSQLAMLRNGDAEERAPRVWAALTAIQSEP